MCIAKILEDRKTDNMAEVEHEGGVGRDGTFPFPDASGDLRGAVLRGAATIFFPKPSAIEREAGRTGMIFPSITTLIHGLAITAILGLVGWYVWRTAPVLPYPLESTGTWLSYVQGDAVNSKKVA